MSEPAITGATGAAAQDRLTITQVLTLIDAAGSYGGPTTVALAQCRELAARGHRVRLVAGWDGLAEVHLPGVEVHLHRVRRLPGLGFAGLWSPALWRTVRRLATDSDVVHLHLARDLVQLPAGLLARSRARIVVQPHGMVRSDPRRSARALDALLTRPLLGRTAAGLALTEAEAADLPRVAHGPLTIHRIRNGIAPDEGRARPPAEGEVPVVAFVARLHARKRPVALVEAAALVLAAGHRLRVDLHGPDEGELAAVRGAIEHLGLAEHVHYRGPAAPSQVRGVLLASHAYVLPSRAEPFPMSVLEAMAVGLPTVITDDTGISAELAAAGAAVVVDGSPASLADALILLLSDKDRWYRVHERSLDVITSGFSPSDVATTLESVYSRSSP